MTTRNLSLALTTVLSVLLLHVADARAVVIYDLTITDTGGGLSGSGSLTFADGAFDIDGIFDQSGSLLDASITTNGTITGPATFDFSELVIAPGNEYQVAGGILVVKGYSDGRNVDSRSRIVKPGRDERHRRHIGVGHWGRD